MPQGYVYQGQDAQGPNGFGPYSNDPVYAAVGWCLINGYGYIDGSIRTTSNDGAGNPIYNFSFVGNFGIHYDSVLTNFYGTQTQLLPGKPNYPFYGRQIDFSNHSWRY